LNEQPFGNQLIAGDTWTWTEELTRVGIGYSAADGYILKYFFRGPSVLDLVATSDTNATGFAIAATPTQTKALQPGTYQWQQVVFLNGDRTELGRGTVEVLADIQSAAAGAETRSFVKQTLDAVQAVITKRASRSDLEYMVAGRQLRSIPMMDLLKIEGEFKARYRREQIENGTLPPGTNQIRVSFR
jgi:hypothetical protein